MKIFRGVWAGSIVAGVLAPGLQAAPVLLNEFNAVSNSSFLQGGGGDSYFGSAAGNGGDWFELVVVGSGVGSAVDMRGWQVQAQREAGGTFEADDTLVLSQDPFWASVPAGTILTFTESRASQGGMDTVLHRVDRRDTEGWSHSNIWIGDPSLVAYTDSETNGYLLDPVNGVSGFNLNDLTTQFRLLDSSGMEVFGPVGEGIEPAGNEISGSEVFALQQTPSTLVTPTSYYGDTSEEGDLSAHSTFGLPNRWEVAGVLHEQSFAGFLVSDASPVFLTAQKSVAVLTGTPFSYEMQALDVDGDATTISMVAGPPFLNLVDRGNGAATLSGRPGLADGGTHPVTLEVTDNNDGLHRQTFVLTVMPATVPVVVNEYNAVSSTKILAETWSFDQRLGLVEGNGDDWIELVVVGDGTPGSTVDLRGWRIEVKEDGVPAGTIVLTSAPFWQSVPAGSILTFTEEDAARGGYDTSLLADDRFGTEGWGWSNIYIGDSVLVDQALSDPEIGIAGDRTQISILSHTSTLVSGPYGEGAFSARTINDTEVFRLAGDPAPSTHPLTASFSEGRSSTFGGPNRLPESDGTDPAKPAGTATGYQSFVAFATGSSSQAPYFTNLWGGPEVNNCLPGSTWVGPMLSAEDPDHGSAELRFSVVAAPDGVVLTDHGNGTASWSWLPSAGQEGIHPIKVKVSDPQGAYQTRTVRVAVMPASSPVLVNEYNAVSSGRFLNGGDASVDGGGTAAADGFFGRIEGNGGDWLELVVVGDGGAGSAVDLRGWQIVISENFGPPRTIVLSEHSYWSAVRAGSILTFVERDLLSGGLDSAIHRVNRFQSLGYAWTNIVLSDSRFVNQDASSFDGNIPLTASDIEISILDGEGRVRGGPVGERRILRNVSSDEVFHLERSPGPDVSSSVADASFPNYADNHESSSFGAPNRWVSAGGEDAFQDFSAYLGGTDTNSRAVFVQLPGFFYGSPGMVRTQQVQAIDADGSAGIQLSVVDSPAWVSLVDEGGGRGLLSWSPPDGARGFYDITIRADDGVHQVDREFEVFVHGRPAPVLVNEYNAVSASSYLNGGGELTDGEGGAASDAHFGRVEGNGGDWFELVVVGDDAPGFVDLRGWAIEVALDAEFPFAADSIIRLSDHDYWSAVPHGTILTFTEERASEGGMDTSLDHIDRSDSEGWRWSNVWIGDSQLIDYTSPQLNGYQVDAQSGSVSGFGTSGIRTQILLKDSSGEIVYGPAGEGVSPVGGVSSRTVWHYGGDPRSSVSPHVTADPAGGIPGAGVSSVSSFGHPNRWADGAEVQDFLVFMSPFAQYVAAAGLSGLGAQFSADPDGDLFTNGQEFAHGTDPTSSLDRPSFLYAESSGVLSFTFPRRMGGDDIGAAYQVDGVRLEVEYSTDLVSWNVTSERGTSPSGLPKLPVGYEYATMLVPASVHEGADRAFMRIRLSVR